MLTFKRSPDDPNVLRYTLSTQMLFSSSNDPDILGYSLHIRTFWKNSPKWFYRAVWVNNIAVSNLLHSVHLGPVALKLSESGWVQLSPSQMCVNQQLQRLGTLSLTAGWTWNASYVVLSRLVKAFESRLIKIHALLKSQHLKMPIWVLCVFPLILGCPVLLMTWKANSYF